MATKINKDEEKQKKQFINYARYSGIAFQMVVVILLGVFGGMKLDAYLNTNPYLTLLCSLLSVCIAIYLAIKDFIRTSK